MFDRPASLHHLIPHRRIATALCCLLLGLVAAPLSAADEGTTKGSLIVNGKTVELPHVYVWALNEGFYKPSDPTWKILFVERPMKPRDLSDSIWDAAWIEIGITESADMTGKPELQVYTQSIAFSADAAGNMSGGTYPEIEIEGLGSEQVSGRIWHAEPQQHFETSYQYDFSFSAPISDPNAPIGDILPAGGGEPGEAYTKWVETVHAGDVDQLKTIVPSNMAEQLDTRPPAEVREEIEFMKAMTPKDIRILSGSTDGEIAILQIEGVMEGEKINAEVTMTRIEDFWIPTEVSL